jgi:hypothetical protein
LLAVADLSDEVAIEAMQSVCPACAMQTTHSARFFLNAKIQIFIKEKSGESESFSGGWKSLIHEGRASKY